MPGILLTIAAILLTPLVAASTADRPPNVVLVFADDLGYADVGVFGPQGYSTPQIARLAAEGAGSEPGDSATKREGSGVREPGRVP